MNKRLEKMAQNRGQLITAARKAFGEKGFTVASMDELTSSIGLTRGALYHNFGDKLGLLLAVVKQIDAEMAQQAVAEGMEENDEFERLMTEGVAYIKMALIPEIQQIVLKDGIAFLGDPTQWSDDGGCLQSTIQIIERLKESGRITDIDPEITARLLNGLAFNTALYVAHSSSPAEALPKSIDAFKAICCGLTK